MLKKATNLFITITVYIYYLLLKHTVSFNFKNMDLIDREIAEKLTPVIGCIHASLLIAALAWEGRPITLLASLSADGSLAARLFEKRGFCMVRGSSSKGGQEALSNLKFALEKGNSVGITFDGPRGPALIPKYGVGVCAWHASGSLFLLSVKLRKSFFWRSLLCLRLSSWDKFMLPLPFATFEVVFTKIAPLNISKDNKAEWVEAALQLLQEKTLKEYS